MLQLSEGKKEDEYIMRKVSKTSLHLTHVPENEKNILEKFLKRVGKGMLGIFSAGGFFLGRCGNNGFDGERCFFLNFRTCLSFPISRDENSPKIVFALKTGVFPKREIIERS